MSLLTKRSFLTRTFMSTALALATAVGGASALSQNDYIASDIVARLAPSSGAHQPEAHQVVTMRVPTPGGGSETIKVDYGHSVDLAVYFPYDSSSVTPQAKAILAELGGALNSPDLQGHRFLIAGHTDAKGDANYNLALSHRRARAVTEFLAMTYGVRPSRLVPVGFGEQRPANAHWPEDPLNRRVEITLIVD